MIIYIIEVWKNTTGVWLPGLRVRSAEEAAQGEDGMEGREEKEPVPV